MRELPLILNTLVEEANKVFQKPPLKWYPDQVNPNDLQLLQHEATNDSKFDPLGLRRSMWEQVVKGEAKVRAKHCTFAKIIWIQTMGTRVEPPWYLWGRIVQWLGQSSFGQPWRIFWLPSPQERLLPAKGQHVGPANVNGGYCYPCRADSIFIYRYEEATRVFIHELLHASCLDPDPKKNSLMQREANIETWAELFMVAMCSKGDKKEAKRLWEIQSQWIANQNHILHKIYHIKDDNDYVWRYTLGREEVLKELHIELPKAKNETLSSCRLTSPALCL